MTAHVSVLGRVLWRLIFICNAFAAILASGPVLAEPSKSVLFIDVNVVPMDREHIMRNQSVLIEKGIITKISTHIERNKDQQIVNGHGQYLLPGLADMHVHSTTSRDMKLFLANGVTTVLNMGGERPAFIDSVVPRLNRGEIPGPHFYSSLRVDGTAEYGELVIANPAQARAMVDIAKTNGYDFVKVYNNLAADTFQALIDEGKVMGVPVVGHGVTRVGLEKQLAAGQVMVAHAEEYFYTVFFPPGMDVGESVPDIKQIAAAVAFTKKSGAYVTADLNTYATIAAQWGKPSVAASFLQSADARYLDPDDRLAWQATGYSNRSGSLEGRLAFLRKFIKALSDAGVPLIAGTDAPSLPGLVPGFSLHQNLHALELAGLTRYQVLSAATRTPGAFIAQTKPGGIPFGTVTAGARADLILVANNPLDDLSTLATANGVVSHGHWYSRKALASMLDELAKQYDPSHKP